VILGILALGMLLFLGGDDLRAMGAVLISLPVALAVSLGAHLPQIALTAWSWQVLLPRARRLPVRTMLALRWYREAADALLPAGALVGQAAVVRLMVRRGVAGDLATATATVSLSLEAVSQLLFTLAGLGLLVALGDGFDRGAFAAGLALALVTTLALVGLQYPLPLRLLRAGLARLARRWPRLDPAFIDDLQGALRKLHADRRSLVLATALHFGAWMMGAVELMLIFGLLGHPIGFAEAIIIESLAQILRNAGFLLPGALGVQEGAIIAAAAIFGLPAATALTAALVRRTREVLVGIPGLAAWRRAELASTPAAALRTMP
jgi:putative membrane protein